MLKIILNIFGVYFLLFNSFSAGSQKNVSQNSNHPESNPTEWINVEGIPPVGNQVVAGRNYQPFRISSIIEVIKQERILYENVTSSYDTPIW